MFQLCHPYMTTGKAIALTRQTSPGTIFLLFCFVFLALKRKTWFQGFPERGLGASPSQIAEREKNIKEIHGRALWARLRVASITSASRLLAKTLSVIRAYTSMYVSLQHHGECSQDFSCFTSVSLCSNMCKIPIDRGAPHGRLPSMGSLRC